ncbi:MBL fold metallo-hydrolase [Streptomyces bobili]|uniref:MBL fold metallo-hydrolase n=1 Tax=Streptomyces bobili TaxID=67280 RepID=UPI00341B708E
MDVIALLPRLHLLRFPVGQACLWRDADELTLVDAGPPGSGRAIADAVIALGHDPAAVRRVVLTHFHEDHAGGAAELAALTGAQVLAHTADAAVLRREVPYPAPVLEEWERPLHAAALRHLPVRDVEPPPLMRELADGDVLAFGGGARVVHVPGHTDGSIALHLPGPGVLFTGATVAASPLDGSVMPGVFNLDRHLTVTALHRLAALDTDVACFGHGDRLTRRASAALREAADSHRPTP